VSSSAAAAAPTFRWVDRFGGRGRDTPRAVAVTADGWVYSVGQLAHDRRDDERSWTGEAARERMFLARHAPDGRRDWLLRFGGSPVDEPRALAVAPGGTVVVGGLFTGELAFGTTAAIHPLRSIGSADAFLVGVDAEGAPRWALSWGGKYADAVRAVAVDAAGNLYVAGTFQLTADFDAGDGRTLMTSAGRTDGFVLKLDSARRLLWARRFGESGADDVTGIAVATDGTIYVGGGFEGTTSQDDRREAPALAGSLAVTALAPDGTPRWERRLDADAGASLAGLATGASGGVYVGGVFQGQLRFAGREALANPASWDVFVARLDASGSLVWARDVGAGTERSLSAGGLAATAAGPLLGGSFQDRVDLGPGPAARALDSESRAPFLLAFDEAGALTWADAPTTSGLAQILAVAAEAGGRAAVLGVGEPRRDGEDEDEDEDEGSRELVVIGLTLPPAT